MRVLEHGGNQNTLAVSFASLFVVLACVICLPISHARGTDVWLANGETPRSDCGDGRPIFVRLKADGQLVINRVGFARQQGEDHLRDEMSTRAERVLYVMADGEVIYDRLAGLVSRLHADSDPVYVVLVTKKANAEPWPRETPAFGPLARHVPPVSLKGQ